jgi:hypothetical protein
MRRVTTKIPAIYTGKSKLGSVKDFGERQMDGENPAPFRPQPYLPILPILLSVDAPGSRDGPG